MENITILCLHYFMKQLKFKKIDVTKEQHSYCVKVLQKFFKEYPDYDGIESPKEYDINFKTDLSTVIEDLCFEVFHIKNRDTLFLIADCVIEDLSDELEYEDEEEQSTDNEVWTIMEEVKQYEALLKEKGIQPGLVCEFPRLYLQASKGDAQALSLIKKLEKI